MKIMMKRVVLLLVTLVLVAPSATRAQMKPDFSGTWKVDKVDPPLPAGRGRGAVLDAAYAENTFSPAPTTLVIKQTGSEISVQTGSTTAVYTLDNTLKVTPPNDVMALKTRAHWDGAKLHLHQKQGQNFSRDILSLNGGALSVLKDLESGGGSTTRTITYTKTS
jgi:hypothetical protein